MNSTTSKSGILPLLVVWLFLAHSASQLFVAAQRGRIAAQLGTAVLLQTSDEILPNFMIRPFDGVYFSWALFSDLEQNRILVGTWNYTSDIYVGIGIRSDKRMMGPIIVCYVNTTSAGLDASCDDFVSLPDGYGLQPAPPSAQLSTATSAAVNGNGAAVTISFSRVIKWANESDSQADIDMDGFARVIFARGKWPDGSPLPKQHTTDDAMQTMINFVDGTVQAVESSQWKLAIAIISGVAAAVLLAARTIRCFDLRIPPLMRTLLALFCCLLAIGSLVGFGAARYYDYKATYAPKALARCAGDMAALSLAMLIFPVGKRIIFSDLLGVSHERAVQYHLFMACCFVVTMTMHFAGMAYFFDFSYLTRWRDKDQVSRLPGIITYILTLLMFPFALLRNKVSFRLFRWQHYSYTLVGFFATCHYPTLALFLIPGLSLLALCFLHRRLASPVDDNETVVTCRFEADANVVVLECVKDDLVLPGQWYFISLPEISLSEAHPFFVARCQIVEELRSIRFVIQPTGNPKGWTRRLVEIATQGKMPRSYKLDGPYGIHTVNAGAYTHLAMICGGIGISSMLHFLRECAEGPDDLRIEDKHSITFIWVVRRPGMLRLFQQDIENAAEEILRQNSKIQLNIRVFVTGTGGGGGTADGAGNDVELSDAPTVLMAGTNKHLGVFRGQRPNWDHEMAIIDKLAGTDPVATFISASPSIAKDLRTAASGAKARHHLHEDTFQI